MWSIAKCRGVSCTRLVEGDYKGRPYIRGETHEILKSQIVFHCLVVNVVDHPVDAKLVGEHAISGIPESFFQRHGDQAAH